MTDDDRAVMERLAALEAEMKADAEAQRARKEAALAKVREQRAKQQAERDELRQRQAELVTKSPRDERRREADDAEGLGGALELAGKANRVRNELARKPRKGEKSWVKSAIASTALGPVGWLYAGSLREAVPAATAWVAALAIAQYLPTLLLLPALMVILPLSGLAGVLYAVQYNRNGGRQRLFGENKKKQLGPGET